MSCGVTPASPNNSGASRAPPLSFQERPCPPIPASSVWAALVMYTGGCFRLAALSAEVMTKALAPSASSAQSSMCRGVEEHSGGQVVLHGDGPPVHDGLGVETGVISEGHRHRAKMLHLGTELVHVATRPQCAGLPRHQQAVRLGECGAAQAPAGGDGAGAVALPGSVR